MGEARPLVSVIMPTYNRANYLAEAITSVVEQSYGNFELLIIDNGSTDQTRAIVESYHDSRIRYFYQENSGSPVSPRNRGFRNARGEIISFLDSDDIWLPDKLLSQVAQFEQFPSVGLVYSDCLLIDHTGRVGGRYSDYHRPHHGQILEPLLRSNFIPAVSVALRKRMLVEFGYLDEAYLIAHDLDLYLKIANSYPINYIDRPLAKLRIHDVSLTRNRMTSRMEVMRVVKPWCFGKVGGNLSSIAKRRIWAFLCFLTGLELLGVEEGNGVGRSWLKEALRHHPIHPLYWGAFFLSLAPTGIAGKTLRVAKKRWSVEGILQS